VAVFLRKNTKKFNPLPLTVSPVYRGRSRSNPFPLTCNKISQNNSNHLNLDYSTIVQEKSRSRKTSYRSKFIPGLFFLVGLAGFIMLGSISLASKSKSSTASLSGASLDVDFMEQCRGWRVELNSFDEELKADAYVDSLRNMMNVEISTLYRGGNYKVQVGSFEEQFDAAKFRDFLRQIGFENAWIVECRILTDESEERIIEKVAPELDFPEPELEHFAEITPHRTITKIRIGNGRNGFRIQIMALFDSPISSANDIAKNAQASLGMGAQVFQSTKAYKVRVGEFSMEEEATGVLKEVRYAGYWDAYIVDNDIINE